MKKYFIVVIILFQSSVIYSQHFNEDISFGLRYPIPIGDNFLNKAYTNGYKGLIDFEVGYGIIKMNNASVGFLFNASYLVLSEIDLKLLVLSPKLSFGYTFCYNKLTISPQLAFGYSNWRFRIPDVIYTDQYGNIIKKGYNQNANGLTYGCATKLAYNLNSKMSLYAQIAYEYTKIEKPKEETIYLKSDRNLQIIYPGIGMIWKFN